MSDLWSLTATEALARFRDRSLSPVELTEAIIARAEATEPVINALSYRHFDAALAAARKAEARYMAQGPKPRALEGLCVAVKDSGHIRGQATSAGSMVTSDVARRDTSPVNQHVLRAGAIVHARSATPEFSCATVTHSRRWGVTRNPWNTELTPGGSSGGAAAALAAGSATLATGSDIAGSIRIPAACCGVVGLKPSRGRNPVDPPFNLDFYCHTGPLARTVSDALLLQNAMCGPHPDDPTLLRPRQRLVPDGRGLEGWRIALSVDLGFYEVDPEVVANTRALAARAADMGATVEEVSLPWDWDVVEAALTHLRQIFGTSIAVEAGERAHLLTPYARAFAEDGLTVTPREFYAALDVAGRVATDLGRLMSRFDLLICPTTAIPAVPARFDHSRDRLKINGNPVEPMLGWVMTVPFNMASTHPVLSLPSGRAANGVPTGAQLVGRSFRDIDVMRAGFALETHGGTLAPIAGVDRA